MVNQKIEVGIKDTLLTTFAQLQETATQEKGQEAVVLLLNGNENDAVERKIDAGCYQGVRDKQVRKVTSYEDRCWGRSNVTCLRTMGSCCDWGGGVWMSPFWHAQVEIQRPFQWAREGKGEESRDETERKEKDPGVPETWAVGVWGMMLVCTRKKKNPRHLELDITRLQVWKLHIDLDKFRFYCKCKENSLKYFKQDNVLIWSLIAVLIKL